MRTLNPEMLAIAGLDPIDSKRRPATVLRNAKITISKIAPAKYAA